MRCRNCGEKIHERDIICSKCGAPIKTSSLSKKRKIILTIALITVVAIGILIAIVFVLKQNTNKKYVKQIALADGYLTKLDYEQAAISYREAINIEPKNADAYLGLAEAYEKMGNNERALAVLQDGYNLTQAVSLAYGIERIKNNIETTANSQNDERHVSQIDGTNGLDDIEMNGKELQYTENANEEKNTEQSVAAQTEKVEENNQKQAEPQLFIKKKSWFSDGSCYAWETYEYNEKGNPIKILNYGSDKTLNRTGDLQYDENGNKISEKWTFSDGKIYEWYKYEYNPQGKKIKLILLESSYSDGYWYEYEYDTNGNPIKGVCYNNDGSLYCRLDYENDRHGNIVSELAYDEAGNTLWYNEFDKFGNVTKHGYDLSETEAEYFEYEYDSQGNIIKMVLHNQFVSNPDGDVIIIRYDYTENP